MKYRPIIFTTESIQAILDDRKSMTRRVIKPQPEHCVEVAYSGDCEWIFYNDSRKICPYGKIGDVLWIVDIISIQGMENYGAGDDGNIYRIKDGTPWRINAFKGGYKKRYLQVKIGKGNNRKNYYVHRLVCEAFYGKCPLGMDEVRHLDGDGFNNEVNNLDWGTKSQNASDKHFHNHTFRKLTKERVEYIKSREWGTWKDIPVLAEKYRVKPKTIEAVLYKKDYMKSFAQLPITMPRIPHMINLEITDIRVERVQDISATEAIDEGLESEFDTTGKRWCMMYGKKFEGRMTQDPRVAFHTLWDSINAKRGYSWESNSWVWVITFKRIK